MLDNCCIHHSEEIRQLVEDEAHESFDFYIDRYYEYVWLDCKLVFLPPYSPDYNPIEQAFSSIKAFLRRHWMDKTLSIIDWACQNITSGKAAAYFRASGYVVWSMYITQLAMTLSFAGLVASTLHGCRHACGFDTARGQTTIFFVRPSKGRVASTDYTCFLRCVAHCAH